MGSTPLYRFVDLRGLCMFTCVSQSCCAEACVSACFTFILHCLKLGWKCLSDCALISIVSSRALFLLRVSGIHSISSRWRRAARWDRSCERRACDPWCPNVVQHAIRRVYRASCDRAIRTVDISPRHAQLIFCPYSLFFHPSFANVWSASVCWFVWKAACSSCREGGDRRGRRVAV